jgi:hypothetical protein
MAARGSASSPAWRSGWSWTSRCGAGRPRSEGAAGSQRRTQPPCTADGSLIQAAPTCPQEALATGQLQAALAELQAVEAEEAAAAEQAAAAGQQLSALLAKRQAALYDVDIQLALESGQVEALVSGRSKCPPAALPPGPWQPCTAGFASPARQSWLVKR